MAKKQKRKNDEERNQKILKEIEEEMKKIMEESGSLPTDISDFEDLINLPPLYSIVFNSLKIFFP